MGWSKLDVCIYEHHRSDRAATGRTFTPSATGGGCPVRAPHGNGSFPRTAEAPRRTASRLDVTAENNPVLAVAVEQLRARAAFSQCAAQESEQAPVVLPEVEHIALDQPADTARQQLWRILNRIVDDAWDPHGAESREEVAARYLATEQDVEEFIAVAEGRSTGVPAILKKYGFGWVGSFVPALSVVHRLRLAVNDPSSDGETHCSRLPILEPLKPC